MWEDNFYSMSEDGALARRLICLEDADRPLEVLFEPNTKRPSCSTSISNGWIKSVALALAGTSWRRASDLFGAWACF